MRPDLCHSFGQSPAASLGKAVLKWKVDKSPFKMAFFLIKKGGNYVSFLSGIPQCHHSVLDETLTLVLDESNVWLSSGRSNQGYFRKFNSTYVETNETDLIFVVITEDRLHEYSEYFEGPTDTATESKSSDSELRDTLQQMKLDLLDESKQMVNELKKVRLELAELKASLRKM
jgi:hypothetical protein